VSKILTVIRFRPFDGSTVEGRSNERLRRVFLTAATSAIAKLVNTLTILVTVPLTLGYLGAERYGLWMAITAIVAFLGFADLGIGNVILNLVSEASGKNDIESARKYISNAFFMLIGISLSLALLFILIYPYVDWAQFFNVSSLIASKEAGPAAATFVACFLVNLPLSIIPRIQMGYQEGYLSSIWQGISNLLGLVALVVVVHMEEGLLWLVLVITGAPALGSIMNGISLFGFQRPWLIPRFKDINSLLAKHIIWIGFLFLILQVTNAIIYSSDNLIIARILGSEAVTNYAIPSRLFIILPNFVYMFLAPLWPAYGEASSRGDDSWAIKTLAQATLVTSVLCLLASLFLIVFGKQILQIWVGSNVMYSLVLMIGLGVWTTLQSVITAMAMYLNAIAKIRFRAIFALLTALFATLAKVILVGSIGLHGVIWGNIAVGTCLTLVPYSIYLIKRYNKQLQTL
jgi:O-antigen/teichoic acid export membrane protein